MKILSLGTGGFIGAHLTERLLSEGHFVTGVDTHDDKIKAVLVHPKFTFLARDIRQPELAIDHLVQEADLVIDLIAHANPGMYVRMPLEVFELNFHENLRIAEACIRKQKRLIQFSSCEIYGKTVASLMPEKLKDPDDPALATFAEDSSGFVLGPVNKHRWIYSCAKQMLERVLHAYGLQGTLNYTIIRPFNFIGPKIDYFPSETDGVPRVFSQFMEALLKGTPMKLVNGGRNRRCYTYIDDAVECIYRIVANPSGVCDRQIFNIGTPVNEISIRQLAELMCEIHQQEFGVPNGGLPQIIDVTGEDFYGMGYEDSDRRIPDITKARKLLGWEPKYSLRELLKLTMKSCLPA